MSTSVFQTKLLSFLHKLYGDFDYLFWPDLAEAHYSNETVAWMEENILLVEKASNSSYVPQARPIENFWGSLAQKVYEGGWHVSTQ